MAKKIGSLFLILFYIPLCFAAHITMQLMDSAGDTVQQVAVNVPFFIEVAVTSEDSLNSTISVPSIEGLKPFIIEEKTHVSTINSIINGKRSIKKIFRFILRAEKQGAYLIGPAHTTINNRRVSSNTLVIRVGAQQIINATEPFLRLLIDKAQVFVGESIQCTLRFYPGKSTSLDGISQPEFPDFDTRPLEGPFSGEEVIDTNPTKYIEWRTTLFPQKTGTLTIPSIAAIYKIPRKKRPMAFEMFDRFFDRGLEQKQAFSNVIKIKVDPLPEHTKPVHGIGDFNALKAEVDHQVAQEGEAIVYRLILEGNGNFETINSIDLVMPDGLKYYESKSYMDESKTKGDQRKFFEYIIQGIKPGEWKIPAQLFTFFNLKTGTHQDLLSNEVETMIKESTSLPKQSVDNTRNSNSNANNFILPIVEDGLWHAQRERKMPWHIFFLLCSLPLSLSMGYFLYRVRLNRMQERVKLMRQKNAFKIAYATLKKITITQDLSQLSLLIHQLFADYWMIPMQELSDEFILNKLKKTDCPQDVIENWHTFYEELLSYTFGIMQNKQDETFDRVKKWLDYLKTIL
ncbi:MAG: BatD family protein [Candidatus Babeliales bacterium]